MNHQNDIQSFRRLLNEISEMCEHASLTGSLSGGSRRTAQRYNSLLARLVELGDIPDGLFTPVPDDAEYGEIGVEARMLAAYFPNNKEKHKRDDDGDRNVLIRLAPFVGREDLGQLIREQSRNGSGFDINMLSSLAPFLGQDVLGELLRSHMSKDKEQKESAKQEPKPRPEPAGDTEQVKPDYRLQPTSPEDEQIDDLLDLLKSPYLSDGERADVVERLRKAAGKAT